MLHQFEIKRATLEDGDAIAPIFDLYRQFYNCDPDVNHAHAYLIDRLRNNESVIFIACTAERTICGFTQLYPGFTSLGMARVWVLNDLFVVESFRRLGVARKLMHTAHDFARSTGARSITLETKRDNNEAQALYASLGYQPESGFIVYSKQLQRGD